MKNPKEKHIAVPAIVFTPFKKTKRRITFFTFLSLVLSVYMVYKVLFTNLSFNQEQLNEMADFTLNLVFVVAALGLTIFTLPLKTEQPEKEKIMLSYIGSSLLIATISIFTYILSFCDFLNLHFIYQADVFSFYFCLMLVLVCNCITSILSAIVAYFDIKD